MHIISHFDYSAVPDLPRDADLPIDDDDELDEWWRDVRAANAQSDAEPVEAALSYARCGWRVFPIEPNGKRPLAALAPHGVKDATEDVERVAEWWRARPDANVGIATGAGLVVLDVDGPEGEASLGALADKHGPLPATLEARTGRGRHLYFSAPDSVDIRNSAGKLGTKLDVRGCGGYVVAPPSRHESGSRYEWVDASTPLAPMPEWLVALLSDPARPTDEPHEAGERNPPTDREQQYAKAALEGEIAKLRDADEGERNTQLNSSAFALGQLVGAGWLDEKTAVDALRKCAREIGLERAEIERTIRSGLEAGKAKPREPLRDEPQVLRTDLGNARLLVAKHGDDLLYFAQRGLWYTWDGTRWKADHTGEIMRRAKDAAETLWEKAKLEPDDDKRKAAFTWAAKSQERQRLENAIALARSEPGVPVTAADLDSDPWLLNTQSGVLDLRTGGLRAPTREMLVTKICNAPYRPGAQSPLWDSFIATLTGGDVELARYIQRAFGYALYGAWREKAFWFGYGPPDGGKSTFLGALGEVLGDYHVAAAASTWMVQHSVGGNRGDVTRLLGARLVTTIEIRPGSRFDAELVKKVTGGDALVAAAKYEHEIEFRPTFALWFGANDRPVIQEDDEGMWARVRCAPFTHVVPEAQRDSKLREKLTSDEHAPAVLAWLVEGCLAWQREGIGTCAAVETASAAYRREMNRCLPFVEEMCVLTLDPRDAVPATLLRDLYEDWCKANGERFPLRNRAWGEQLRRLGVTGGDDASRHNGHRRWLGIRIR